MYLCAKVKVMKRNGLSRMALLFLMLVALASCGKKQHIQLTKGIIVFSFAGGSDLFEVEADCGWIVEVYGNPDWLTVNPTSGTNNASVAITVANNDTHLDRSAMIAVVSENAKIRREISVVQTKVDISAIVRKVWFLRTYDRWDTDYYDRVIPESYRQITYYSNPGFENWFFYFVEDSVGYEIKTFEGDTIYYPYQYAYYPEGDSLYIVFQTVVDTVESYHAVIHQLNGTDFSFSDQYLPHQFEKLNLVNVTGDRRNAISDHPKKTAVKPKGPLIQLP